MADTPLDRSPIDLRTALRVARAHWFLIILVTAVTTGAVVAWTLAQTPLYQSAAVVSLRPVLNADGNLQGEVSKSFVTSQIELITSRPTQEAVEARIGAPASASAQPLSDVTSNIRISSIDADPGRAALVANTYAEVYADLRLAEDQAFNESTIAVVRERLTEVEAQLAVESTPEATNLRSQYQQQLQALSDQARFIAEGRVDILEPAEPAGSPFSPNLPRNVAAGLLIGLMAGVGAAFARQRFDDKVESTEDIEEATGGLALIGVIPRVSDWKASDTTRVVALEDPTSPIAEAYRTLRTSLQFVRVDDPIRLLQVTSANPFEGKSTTVANLGVTLANAGQRVLLIDLDLRRPRLHKFFDIDNDIGFTSLLKDPRLDERAIAVTPTSPNLGLLTSGPRPPDPSELLASASARATLARLAEKWDLLLLDSPPVLGVSDPLVLSGIVDATLLVIRSRSTRGQQMRAAVSLLRKVQAPLVGVIVNNVEMSRRSYHYGYDYLYGYNYGYGDRGKDSSKSGSRTSS